VLCPLAVGTPRGEKKKKKKGGFSVGGGKGCLPGPRQREAPVNHPFGKGALGGGKKVVAVSPFCAARGDGGTLPSPAAKGGEKKKKNCPFEVRKLSVGEGERKGDALPTKKKPCNVGREKKKRWGRKQTSGL